VAGLVRQHAEWPIVVKPRQEASMAETFQHLDLSGSVFRDVNLRGALFDDVNLAEAR